MGFAKGFGLAKLDQLTLPITRSWALVWLLVAMTLLAGAAARALGAASWWMIVLPALVASQVVITVFWQDAKAGTVANLIILAVVLAGAGRWRFERSAAEQLEAVAGAAQALDEPPLRADELDRLPPVVRRWVERSGAVGKPRRPIVHLAQRGRMRTTEEGSWMPFVAEQWITPSSPAFEWIVDVRAAPGVHLLGRDDLFRGAGRMRIELFGLVAVGDASGPRIDQGAALRFLAELVWCPAAAVEPYVQWQQLSESSAQATFIAGGLEVEGVFSFDEAGDPSEFRAMRYRDDELEEWTIAIGPAAPLGDDGIRVPVRSQVSWTAQREGAEPWTWFEVELLSVDADGRRPARLLAQPPHE